MGNYNWNDMKTGAVKERTRDRAEEARLRAKANAKFANNDLDDLDPDWADNLKDVAEDIADKAKSLFGK